MKGVSIGIKLADGSFYPILEEGTPAAKELELTTVRDNQTTVQVNLYKSATDSITDSEYVGTLIVEDLKPQPKESPTIRMNVKLDADNNLSAEATDMGTGNRSELSVSLAALHESQLLDYPDFSFPDSPIPHKIEKADEFVPAATIEGLYDPPEEKKKPSRSVIICIICAVISLLVLALILFVTGIWSFSPKSDEPETAVVIEDDNVYTPPQTELTLPPKPADEETPVLPDAVEPEVSAEPEPSAEETTPEQPSEAVLEPLPQQNTVVIVEEPVVIPVKPEPPAKAPAGVRYKIKWGDTLWDLADAYYRNPWLYPKIAKENGIKNPDLIISGTYITIPPK